MPNLFYLLSGYYLIKSILDLIFLRTSLINCIISEILTYSDSISGIPAKIGSLRISESLSLL
jgi:hypothetical protein